MENSEYFDITSVSESAQSPIKTSTVARDGTKWSENAFFKWNKNPQSSESMFFTDTQSPMAVLNNVTNIPKDEAKKLLFQQNEMSFVSDSDNSSLGILHGENLSDFCDNSYSETTIHSKNRTFDKSSQQKVLQIKNLNIEEVSDRILKTTLKRNIEGEEEKNCSSSSSDIEYDGTNIPELNHDFDVLSIVDYKKDFTSKSNGSDKSKDSSTLTLTKNETVSEYSTTSTQFSKDKVFDIDTTGGESIGNTRHSIFKDFQPSYESLQQRLGSVVDKDKKGKAPKKLKVSPFLDMSSFEVEPILQQNETSIENGRFSENYSVDFCPHLISARSSSFRSSLVSENKTSRVSRISSKEDREKPLSSIQYCPEEDLKNEVLGGSCFYSAESEKIVESGGNGPDSPVGRILSNFPSEEENWCSRLGISESEFFSSEAAKEIFKKDGEEFEKEQVFGSLNSNKIDQSKWSPPSQLEITATSCLRPPDTKNTDRPLSFGTLMTARSEYLGTLLDDSTRERPYFGTNVTTPLKNRPSSLYDCGGQKFRPSILSDILSEISFTDSYSKIEAVIDEFMPVGSSKIENIDSSIRTVADLQKEGSNIHSSDTEDSEGTLVRSVSDNSVFQRADSDNSVFQGADSDKSVFQGADSDKSVFQGADSDAVHVSKLSNNGDIQSADTSLNISSVGSNSDRTEKSETCSTCSMSSSQQSSVPGYSRPISACSSTCHNPIALQNTYSLQYRCMNYVNAGQDSGQCGVPNNYLLFSNGTPAPCSHVCSQYIVQPNIQPSGVVFPMIVAPGPSLGIQAPPRLCYPEKITVGDSQEIILTIQNAGNAVCTYQVSCVSAYLNSLPLSIEMSGLCFAKTVPSTSGSTTDIKLVLAPKYEGKFEVNLQIDAIAQTISNPGMTAQTKIEFEGLLPSVSLKSKYRDSFNLGSVIAGSTFIEYVSLINNCEVSVPLRITLSNDSVENQIYFGLKEFDRLMCSTSIRPSFLSPKVMLYRLPGTKNNSLTSQLDIPIVFESVKGQVRATISAAVETPTLSELLAFVTISATTGTAKLILKDTRQNPLRLKAPNATTTSSNLTVLNEGSISVVYDLQIQSEWNCFAVSPNSLNMQPQQSAVVSVTFSAAMSQTARGKLLAAAQPCGQVFEILDIFGEVLENFYPCCSSNPEGFTSKPVKNSKDSYLKSANFVQCNKKYLAWGGINIGETKVKTFILRNPGKEIVEAKIFLKDKSPAFQFIDDLGQKTSLKIKLNARQDKEISVAFTPRNGVVYSSCLCIKSTNNSCLASYMIPVSGYGGVAKLKVIGLPVGEGMGYFLNVAFLNGLEAVYKNITIHNTGCRAAFVKVVLNYNNLVQNHSQHQIVIQPSEFVLLENEKKNILICVNSTNKSFASNEESISILYGDEILRQRLKRKRTSYADSTSNMYNINFCVPYDGEQKVPYESLYAYSEKDDHLFFTSLKTVLVHLVFNADSTDFSTTDFTALSMIQDSFSNLTLNSTMSLRRSTIEGHSPPVKDSAIRSINRLSLPIPFEDDVLKSSKISSSSSINELRNFNLQSWTVTPEELVLDAENKDNRILLKNYSLSDMRFKVEWTINIITVSPVSGIVAAKGEIGLRLSLINNNHSKLLQSYQGSIKITCDGAEKVVHVKIQKKGTISSFLQRTPSTLNLSLRSGFLEDSCLDRTIENPIYEILHIDDIFNFPKHIDLLKTKQGTSTELVLNVGNPSKTSVSWNIHPKSVALTEPFDDSVDFSRPAIEFLSPVGIVKSSDLATLTIKFLPLSVAVYSQFFEISTTSESGAKKNCNFKVQGEGVSYFPAENIDSSDKMKNNKSGKGKLKSEIYVEKEIYEFPTVASGEKSTVIISIKNISAQDCTLSIDKPQPPFSLNYSTVAIKSKKFLKIPVCFKPTKPNFYESEMMFITESNLELKVWLKGCCSS